MARRKQKTEARQPDPMNPLEQFAAEADRLNELAPPDPQPEASATDKAMEARLAALAAQVESLERANAALMSAPMVKQQPQLPDAPAALSMEGLPDPTTQPEEYAKELNTRIANHTKAHFDYNQRVAATNAATEKTQKEQFDELWSDFNIEYDELADHPKQVQFAANEVIERARKRGIDIERYVFQNRAKFFADVAKEYDTIFGDGEPSTPTGGDALRTSVMGGGSADAGSRRGAPAAPSSLTKELQAEQRKMNLF